MQLVQSAICTGLEEIIRKKTKTETRNQKHHLLQGTAIPAGPCNLQHTHVCLPPITTIAYHPLPPENTFPYLYTFGCIAQWLERRSLTGELSLASARSAADV